MVICASCGCPNRILSVARPHDEGDFLTTPPSRTTSTLSSRIFECGPLVETCKSRWCSWRSKCSREATPWSRGLRRIGGVTSIFVRPPRPRRPACCISHYPEIDVSSWKDASEKPSFLLMRPQRGSCHFGAAAVLPSAGTVRNQAAHPENQCRRELSQKRPHDRCTAPALRVTGAAARLHSLFMIRWPIHHGDPHACPLLYCRAARTMPLVSHCVQEHVDPNAFATSHSDERRNTHAEPHGGPVRCADWRLLTRTVKPAVGLTKHLLQAEEVRCSCWESCGRVHMYVVRMAVTTRCSQRVVGFRSRGLQTCGCVLTLATNEFLFSVPSPYHTRTAGTQHVLNHVLWCGDLCRDVRNKVQLWNCWTFGLLRLMSWRQLDRRGCAHSVTVPIAPPVLLCYIFLKEAEGFLVLSRTWCFLLCWIACAWQRTQRETDAFQSALRKQRETLRHRRTRQSPTDDDDDDDSALRSVCRPASKWITAKKEHEGVKPLRLFTNPPHQRNQDQPIQLSTFFQFGFLSHLFSSLNSHISLLQLLFFRHFWVLLFLSSSFSFCFWPSSFLGFFFLFLSSFSLITSCFFLLLWGDKFALSAQCVWTKTRCCMRALRGKKGGTWTSGVRRGVGVWAVFFDSYRLGHRWETNAVTQQERTRPCEHDGEDALVWLSIGSVIFTWLQEVTSSALSASGIMKSS